MIKTIVDILRADDFYNSGEYIEIAKGKNKIPKDWNDFNKKIKRKRWR